MSGMGYSTGDTPPAAWSYTPPEVRDLSTDDFEAILRAPERLRARALDLERQSLNALLAGEIIRATEIMAAATECLKLAEAFLPPGPR